jgi:alpha-tubulin suppressor-like RCC1 family protein
MKAKFLHYRKVAYRLLFLLFHLFLFIGFAVGQSESNDMITYDTLIKYTGRSGQSGLTAGVQQYWMVRITRPTHYFTAGNADTASRPLILSMPGVGEVGTDETNLVKYGPHFWLNNGWDGSVTLGNGKHYPLLITVCQAYVNTRPWFTQSLIDTLIKYYHPRANSIHMSALSQGVWVLGESLKYAAFPGDEHTMPLINSFTDLEGVGPSDTYGSDTPYPNFFGHWVSKYGGRFWGLEGISDPRNVWQIAENINDSASGKAYFTYQGDGGGAHCCWNDFYNPAVTNWQDMTAPFGNSFIVADGLHPNTTGTYSAGTGNLFQWMLRQGDTTLLTGSPSIPSPTPPTVSAGAKVTITLPVSVAPLTGTAAGNGGATISSVAWTQTSGPNTAVITAAASLVTSMAGLVQGTYVFTLTATDNNSMTASATDTVVVNAASAPPPPSGPSAKTLVGTGEYQVFFLDQNRHLYGIGANYATLGVGGSGTLGLALPVVVTPSNLTFKTVAGGLHGGAAIDTNGYVWAFGDNTQGQFGNGSTVNTSVAVQLTVDSLGNPFTNISQVCAYFSGNANQGWYAIKNDGTLWIWGSTLNGMRGNGTMGGSNLRPVQVPIPGGRLAKQVVAGTELILLCTDGTVWTCGGNGQFAQNLGYAATGSNYLSLHQLASLSNITQVAGGLAFNYALKNDGTLYGWGYNGSYLGYYAASGSGTPLAAPTVLSNITGALPHPISSIVTNTECTHVILSDGSLWGWGDNAQGNIGTSAELNYATTTAPYAWDFLVGDLLQQLPVRIVPTRSDFVAVFGSSVFTFYTYAETADGTLYSWGRNKGNILGNGVISCSPDVTASYPNSWDVTAPTVVNPLVLTRTTIVPCPYCILHPGGTPCNECSTPIIYPLANAGANITITLPVNTVTLNGSASSNPGGGTLTYSWTEITGPSSSNIGTASGATTTAGNLIQGVYQFQLVVTNSSGNTDTATTQVTVNPAPIVTPVANAGTAITITLPVNTANLDGSASSNPGGGTLTYAWSEVSGPATYAITSPTAATTSVTNLVQGVYVFRLTVTNSQGNAATASVTVTVNPAPVVIPVANAGTDITITLPVNTVNLDGSASSNPGGGTLTYAWSEVSGPATYAISSPTASTTPITNLAQGVYVFSLTVTNSQGNAATASVTVTVNPAPVVIPIANAGTDITITLPVNTVNLDGSASSNPGGGTLIYSWSEVSGPVSYTIASPTASTTGITNLVQGIYVFSLTVTNSQGNAATASVTVTVNPAPVVIPIANAGTDITITLPVNTVNLDGSASSNPGGGTLTYLWSETSGPATFTITNATASTTSVTNLVQGVYIFSLTVTNSQGNTAIATVTVTVNDAASVTPIANAGTAITITLPVNTVNLDGSASSNPGGGALTYVWSEISGPATFSITSPASSTTAITNLVEGVYVFRLTVTNGQGNAATASVTVTVNPAPVVIPIANAGTDIAITLPVNSVNLDGSASSNPGGGTLTYAWSEVSGPVSYTIASPTASTTGITNLVQGVYVFRLTVTNSQGNVATASVTVTVNPAPVVIPAANAGTDITITLPVNTVNLDGSASSNPGGGTLTYAWSEVSGPATYAITSPGSSTTPVANLVQGVYVFRLTVTNSQGNAATASVTVTVNPALFVIPLANAGTDITITLPVNSVNLDGSASSDPGGGTLTYAWAQVSGPVQYTIASPSNAGTAVTNLVQGVYVFSLTVINSQGHSATATVTVTVNANDPANIPPVANAGSDTTVFMPFSSLGLNGSKSYDPDGTIASYNWYQLSGTAAALTIVNSNSATPTVYGLVPGTYMFELMVTDNDGATSKSDVIVVVKDATASLVANAGADTTIGLPASTAVLDGTGSSDAGGTITSYQWVQSAGPSSASLASPNAPLCGVSALEPGVYIFSLTVTDDQGATSTDTMQVRVVDDGRFAPGDVALLYPNPAQDHANLHIVTGANGSVEVNVYNILGARLIAQQSDKQESTLDLTIPTSRLASGTYIVQVLIGGKKWMNLKLVKQ